jgi:hypothetical protein
MNGRRLQRPHFLLWQPNQIYTIIPKRFASAAQLGELREYLQQRIPQASVGFPIVPVARQSEEHD